MVAAYGPRNQQMHHVEGRWLAYTNRVPWEILGWVRWFSFPDDAERGRREKTYQHLPLSMVVEYKGHAESASTWKNSFRIRAHGVNFIRLICWLTAIRLVWTTFVFLHSDIDTRFNSLSSHIWVHILTNFIIRYRWICESLVSWIWYLAVVDLCWNAVYGG